MVSRCKIISRSSNELYSCHNMPYDLQDEDIWFNPDKLYQDHILEILQKWDAIDDEIWAKIIVMERNRRVAKAYVRAPAISINGTEAGFDGYTIGINGFESSTSDAKVLQVKKMIGKGVKLKMDQFGNIIIKRLSRCNVFIRSNPSKSSSSSSQSSSSSSSSICVPIEKAIKLFDMKSFASNIDSELMNSYPDRRKLESQAITLITFVQDTPSSILDSPCYLLLINIVAIDMLKSRLPPSSILPPIPVSSSSSHHHSSSHKNSKSSHQNSSSTNQNSSLSSNSSSGSNKMMIQPRSKTTKFTSFDPKVTHYTSTSGTSSGSDPTNSYTVESNNNQVNYNNQSRKKITTGLMNGNHQGTRNGNRTRDSLPTPDYDDGGEEEEIEQVYGTRNPRYQKNTNSSSFSSSSNLKPISKSAISKSSGKLISNVPISKNGKTSHPLKPLNGELINRMVNPNNSHRLLSQSNYGLSNRNNNGSNYNHNNNSGINYKLSKSQSTSHLNSYQTSKSSSSNGFSLSDSSDPYTSIKTSLDSEEIYPAFRGGFVNGNTHALFDYHPFGGMSSGRMTESSFTDEDISNPYKLNGNPKVGSRYARNWK